MNNQFELTNSLVVEYWAGRVTALRMRAVCHSDASNPLQSLVKYVCYHEAFRFTSKQTAWVCKHETSAKAAYGAKTKEKHIGFLVNDSGFVINPQWPWPCLGASPDGVISCNSAKSAFNFRVTCDITWNCSIQRNHRVLLRRPYPRQHALDPGCPTVASSGHLQ